MNSNTNAIKDFMKDNKILTINMIIIIFTLLFILFDRYDGNEPISINKKSEFQKNSIIDNGKLYFIDYKKDLSNKLYEKDLKTQKIINIADYFTEKAIIIPHDDLIIVINRNVIIYNRKTKDVNEVITSISSNSQKGEKEFLLTNNYLYGFNYKNECIKINLNTGNQELMKTIEKETSITSLDDDIYFFTENKLFKNNETTPLVSNIFEGLEIDIAYRIKGINNKIFILGPSIVIYNPTTKDLTRIERPKDTKLELIYQDNIYFHNKDSILKFNVKENKFDKIFEKDINTNYDTIIHFNNKYLVTYQEESSNKTTIAIYDKDKKKMIADKINNDTIKIDEKQKILYYMKNGSLKSYPYGKEK